jgi:hypothetical protein
MRLFERLEIGIVSILVVPSLVGADVFNNAPKHILLSSEREEHILTSATGEYTQTGNLHRGQPTYICQRFELIFKENEDPKIFNTTLWLYRSELKGVWLITRNESNMLNSKGIIMSEESSSTTPIGLTYRFFFDGVWMTDRTFRVEDISRQRLFRSIIKKPWIGVIAVATTAVAVTAVGWVS